MSKNRPIRRETADRLLQGLQQRILEINSDDSYAFVVERAVVFGSYVNTDRDILGDLDIGVLLSDRFGDDETVQDMAEERARGRYRGKRWVEEVIWPQTEILRYLRNGSPHISIHNIGTEDDEAIFSKKTIELNV